MKAVYSKCVHLLADDLYNTLNFNYFVSYECMHYNKVITYTFRHKMITFIFKFSNICFTYKSSIKKGQ